MSFDVAPAPAPASPALEAVRFGLGALLAVMAVNAFAGGLYGMVGAPAVPVSWLVGSPFDSYVVPGAFLFVVVGGAFAIAADAVFRRRDRARTAALAAGAIALAWIAAQVFVIGIVSFLQPAVSIVALVVMATAALLPRSHL